MKIDGENTTIHSTGYHARSLDSRCHPSRSWVAQFANTISYRLLPNHKICGENLFAQHSIHYHDLESYFYGFSYWIDDTVLSWDDTIEKFKELNVVTVPIIYTGILNKRVLNEITHKFDTTMNEGFVVRTAQSFHVDNFSKHVLKWVRSEHVQTDHHWMNKSITMNHLSSKP